MKNKALTVLFSLFCLLILALSLRGLPGNPTAPMLDSLVWKDNGPLELSPERGRFVLTYSLIEDRSFTFSIPLARFATPDVGYKDGKYVSLFAPGVSFIVMPGYVLGKLLGASQVGTFAVISIFALLNTLLIRSIALRLGAGLIAATLGAFTFLFASPAFAYAVTLYQHHISTFLILASLYLLLKWNNVWSLALIWFLIAVSIPVDYPNLFLMAPIGIASGLRFFQVTNRLASYNIQFSFIRLLSLIAVLAPLLFFFWFNANSYGNPLQLSGTVSSAKAIDENGLPTTPVDTGTQDVEHLLDPTKQKKSSFAFFQTRNLTNGMATHVINRDRGILWYSPVLFLGVFGAVILYRTKRNILTVLVGIIGVNFVLYSLWADPYGGWAFGSRYLIPTYAVSAILLAIALTKWGRKISFTVLFTLLFVYSVSINAVGAITSSRNPPKAEVLGLEKLSGREEKYSFDRNFQFLETTGSKSFVYQTYAYKFVDARTFYLLLVGAIGSVGTALIVIETIRKKEVVW
ncbi:MAG: hypothetical protein HY431_00940 [Candidatus Levybacteria bacterium]|nr:hypothetical protein [Candidatus Levybacteria bacterium]